MNTTKKRMCFSIILVVILVSLFRLTVFALNNKKNNNLNPDILNIDILDSMVEKCKKSKIIFTSQKFGISISAPKDYVQDMDDDSLYISNENIEILSLRFDDKEDVIEYIDDMYAYLSYDAINVKSTGDIKFNIEKANSSVIQYTFEYEESSNYKYYTYFIMSKYDNDYVLSFVGTHSNIDNYYYEIKDIVETIKIDM